MAKRIRYHDWLIKNLADPLEAEGYLNAVLDEYPEGLAKAIRNVAEAKALSAESGSKSATKNVVESPEEHFGSEMGAMQSALHEMGLKLTISRENEVQTA